MHTAKIKTEVSGKMSQIDQSIVRKVQGVVFISEAKPSQDAAWQNNWLNMLTSAASLLLAVNLAS